MDIEGGADFKVYTSVFNTCSEFSEQVLDKIDRLTAFNNHLVSFISKGLLPYRGIGTGIRRALGDFADIGFFDDRKAGVFKVVVKRKMVGMVTGVGVIHSKIEIEQAQEKSPNKKTISGSSEPINEPKSKPKKEGKSVYTTGTRRSETMLKKEIPLKINGHYVQNQYMKMYDLPNAISKLDSRLVWLNQLESGDIAIRMPPLTALTLYANDVLNNERNCCEIEYEGKVLGMFYLQPPQTSHYAIDDHVVIKGCKSINGAS